MGKVLETLTGLTPAYTLTAVRASPCAKTSGDRSTGRLNKFLHFIQLFQIVRL